MLVIKKINNNAAICLDGNQKELVAFGKGIGFPAMPYELTDLSKVDRTFYDVQEQYKLLLKDIPAEVVNFTAEIMDEVKPKLQYDLGPNNTLILADHIAFALERQKRGVYIKMPPIYELEQEYPMEIKIGRKFCNEIENRFKVRLPKDEIQGIALHFINARDKKIEDDKSENDNLLSYFDEILEQTTQIIEWELDVKVYRDTFNYARFATHVRYLLDRLVKQKHLSTDNLIMYSSARDEYPRIAECVDKIDKYYQENWDVSISEEEKLYLILHINRVCSAQ